MIQLTDNVWAVQVPAESSDHFTRHNFLYWDAEKNTYDSASLPPGQWEFICTSSGASEEQADKIVEKDYFFDIEDADLVGDEYESEQCWKNYHDGPMHSWTALASLKTLLSSKGLEGNYALIKKL